MTVLDESESKVWFVWFQCRGRLEKVEEASFCFGGDCRNRDVFQERDRYHRMESNQKASDDWF